MNWRLAFKVFVVSLIIQIVLISTFTQQPALTCFVGLGSLAIVWIAYKSVMAAWRITLEDGK